MNAPAKLIGVSVVLVGIGFGKVSYGNNCCCRFDENSPYMTGEPDKTDTVQLVRSLEELYTLPPKTTFIEKCDLSNLGPKEIPSLQLYNIRSLDLSHNELRTENDVIKLPANLEELDLSYCNIGAINAEVFNAAIYQRRKPTRPYINLDFENRKFPNLKILNVSHNRIWSVRCSNTVKIDTTNFRKCKNSVNTVRSIVRNQTEVLHKIHFIGNLDSLYALSPGSYEIDTCVSNQGLENIPVLRPYKIKHLNLSGNDLGNSDISNIHTLLQMLPRSLETLDISNCRLGHAAKVCRREREKQSTCTAELLLFEEEFPNLKEVNAANNDFFTCEISSPIVKLNILRNDLRRLFILNETLKSLDVSYNWEMGAFIQFDTGLLEEFKRDSCAHNEKLFQSIRL